MTTVAIFALGLADKADLTQPAWSAILDELFVSVCGNAASRTSRKGSGRMALATWSDLAKSLGHVLLFQALEAVIGPEKARAVAWSLADEAQLLELVSETSSSR
jgi:hypothetical protein